jgi:hypothetical protein
VYYFLQEDSRNCSLHSTVSGAPSGYNGSKDWEYYKRKGDFGPGYAARGTIKFLRTASQLACAAELFTDLAFELIFIHLIYWVSFRDAAQTFSASRRIMGTEGSNPSRQSHLAMRF